METVVIKMDSSEQASRKELLVRLVYWISLVIVLFVIQIIAVILWVVNLLFILFLGKRYLSLLAFNALEVRYRSRFSAYYQFVTDERPPIIPKMDET